MNISAAGLQHERFAAALYVASRGLDLDDAIEARQLDVPAGSVTVDWAVNLSQFQIKQDGS